MVPPCVVFDVNDRSFCNADIIIMRVPVLSGSLLPNRSTKHMVDFFRMGAGFAVYRVELVLKCHLNENMFGG